MKQCPFFSPSLDPGRGTTRAQIENLLASYRAGTHEGADELLAVLDVLESADRQPFLNYLITETSPVCTLMREFSSFLTAELPVYTTGVANATAGLIALLMAHDVAGGEVITTSFNFMGVPNAIVMAGGMPRFVDMNEDDWCMSMSSLGDALSDSTKAVVLTHFNRAVDVEPIRALLAAKGLDIPLIQDASVAMGSTCNGVRPGAVNVGRGGAAVYSFATSKVVTGLGGGMLAANEEAIVARAHTIAYQGASPQNMLVQDVTGANFKMNELNAVIALAQLRRHAEKFETRRRLRAWYAEALAPLIAHGSVTLQALPDESVVTHYAVRIKDRMRVAQDVYDRAGIILGAWPANHLQPLYRTRFGTHEGTLPVTETMGPEITLLPFHERLTRDEVAHMCAVLAQAMEEQ